MSENGAGPPFADSGGSSFAVSDCLAGGWEKRLESLNEVAEGYSLTGSSAVNLSINAEQSQAWQWPAHEEVADSSLGRGGRRGQGAVRHRTLRKQRAAAGARVSATPQSDVIMHTQALEHIYVYTVAIQTCITE